MAYNDLLTRSDAAGLMEPEYADKILQDLPGKSAVLEMMSQEPTLNSNIRYYPIGISKPKAYFVNPTDVGTRQSTELKWEYADLAIEEISTFVVVPNNVLADSKFPIWDNVRPQLEGAIAELIDQTILYGGDGVTGKPATWPDGLVTQTDTANREVSLAACTDLYDALFSVNGTWTLVEQHGFEVTGNLANVKTKARIRELRSESGLPLFRNGELMDTTVKFPSLNTFDETKGLMLSGDFKQAIFALREDITYRIDTTGVISDPDTGAVIYNLAMQKMTAIYVDIRMGWQLPRPVNWYKQSATDRPLPFALLKA
jgi:HK97 family phage major capsid protein